MSNRLVMLQPSQAPDGRDPLPMYVDADGAVQQQGLWKGDPVAVLGFADRIDHRHIDLRYDDFWNDPERAVGRYVVMVDEHGAVSTGLAVIESVLVAVDDPPERRADPTRPHTWGA